VFETTYSHLSDKDTAERIEDAFNVENGEKEEKSLTPAACPTCGEAQPPGVKACQNCGAVFTPDAKQVQAQVQQDVGAEKALAGLGDVEDLSPGDIDALAEDDEIMAQLIQARAGRTEHKVVSSTDSKNP
jgi:ribosomal protein L37AE/L43A